MGRMPTLFVCHGAGPSFFTRWPFGAPDAWDAQRDWLRQGMSTLPATPTGVVVVSAHFIADHPTVTTTERPQQIDLDEMNRFPADVPELTHQLLGAPQLGERVHQLLEAAGIQANKDSERGVDVGAWIPMKLLDPTARLPVTTLSLQADLDPAFHVAVGRALSSLRDEGVLILGSGASFHRMKPPPPENVASAYQRAVAFDGWLAEAVGSDRPGEALTAWESAPGAREAHPTEEHLLPLMVVAGAADGSSGTVAHRADALVHKPNVRAPFSMFRFG